LHNDKRYKTSILKNSSQNPKWKEIVKIPFVTKESKIQITCYDEDYFMEDFVARSTFNIRDLVEKTDPQWLNLKYNSMETAVKIFVKTQLNELEESFLHQGK
jgi:Ca2+-dependent lipid-binding protein